MVNLIQLYDGEILKLINSIQEFQKFFYIFINFNQKEFYQFQVELFNVVKKKMEDNFLFTEKISKVKLELQSERQIRQILEEDFNNLKGKCLDLEMIRFIFIKIIDR